MLGEASFKKYVLSDKPIHYVNPHSVRPYIRNDGTFVSGYWRDGDGNTSINRDTGYFARNPNTVSQLFKKVWNL